MKSIIKQIISLYHIWQYHRALKGLAKKGIATYSPEFVRLTPQGNMAVIQSRRFKNIKEADNDT